MNFLEERIAKDGIVKEGNVLKVDSFLNHQMDIGLFDEIGRELKKRFANRPINKILTIEASGIGIAAVAAMHFGVPVVFAKKAKSINLEGVTGTDSDCTGGGRCGGGNRHCDRERISAGGTDHPQPGL